MIFVGLKAKNQLILVKTMDFKPLVPQKSSVESSMNDDVYQKKVSKVIRSITCFSYVLISIDH